MVYEVISPEAHGSGTIIGMHTESASCIDSLELQKTMIGDGSQIVFSGTQEEYDAVKDKLHSKVKVKIIKDKNTESKPKRGRKKSDDAAD